MSYENLPAQDKTGKAREPAEMMIEHFSAPQGLYDTADDDEALIVRRKLPLWASWTDQILWLCYKWSGVVSVRTR